MITTNDIKIKDQKPEKLTIISTGDVKPKEFVVKGKGKALSTQMITTSNVDKFKHAPRKAVEEKLTVDKKGKANKGFTEGDAVYQKKSIVEKGEPKKKPWNKMNAEERKEHQMKKAKEADAAKKKE